MTSGRPREFDIDRALEAATQQFWAAGYEATSLQDLLKTMRLSKSSLYQTFGNKHELFVCCIDRYQQTMVNALSEQLANSISVERFLHDFLEGVISEAKNRGTRKGCFLVNTANELSQRDPVIAKAVSGGTGNLAEVFRQAIEQGKQQKELDSALPTENLVDYFMTSVSGLRTMVKVGADIASLQPVVQLIMQTLSGNKPTYQ
ncbi:MAG: TetR/AcrR family transcriptional regulator [Porticoccus sp.]